VKPISKVNHAHTWFTLLIGFTFRWGWPLKFKRRNVHQKPNLKMQERASLIRFGSCIKTSSSTSNNPIIIHYNTTSKSPRIRLFRLAVFSIHHLQICRCIFFYESLLFPLRRRAKSEIAEKQEIISDASIAHIYIGEA
jgi:hypothetical protein